MRRRLAVLLMLLAGCVSLWRLPALSHASSPSGANQSQSIDGNWEGTLSVPSGNLKLILKISRNAERLRASLDSPTQGASDLTVDTITFQDGALHFEMKDIGAAYDGVLGASGAEFQGTWKQSGNQFALIFRRAGVARSDAPIQRGRVQLKPCNMASLPGDALCGNYDVFEDRTAKAGRKIALNLILLPALSAKPAPDPLFYFEGGPGGAASLAASSALATRVRRERDVVLVDQRGTGKSNPLNCDLGRDKTNMAGYFGGSYPLEKIRACRAALEKIANLKLYTTTIAMDDLDEVRVALGYDLIDLYGGSYGSTAALVYLRQHPDHVRAAAIFGVAPPDSRVPLSFARGTQHAMDRLFADCAADTACHAAFPGFREEFDTVLKLFDNGPVQVNAPNIYTQQQQSVTMTRDGFRDAVREILYVPNAMSALPLLIHLAAQGDLGSFTGVAFQVTSQIDASIARGMQFSVICAENIPFISDADIKRESAGSFYGDARLRPVMQACAEWPRAAVAPSFLDPVKGNAPVLIVSGDLDPVTPPWLVAPTLRSLSHSRQIIIPNATHAPYDCVVQMVVEFLNKASTEGLDTSCVDQIRRPPFNLPSAQ